MTIFSPLVFLPLYGHLHNFYDRPALGTLNEYTDFSIVFDTQIQDNRTKERLLFMDDYFFRYNKEELDKFLAEIKFDYYSPTNYDYVFPAKD